MSDIIKFLDFSEWLKGGSRARATFVDKVHNEFISTGFFWLTSHGIPEKLLLRTRELSMKFFIECTLEERMRYYVPEKDGQLGYTPLDTEQAVGAKYPDHKHFLMFGDFNQLPDISEVPGLREASLELFEAYHQLYTEFMKVVALTVELEYDHFAGSLGNSSLRLIHYPLHDNPATGDDAADSVAYGGNVVGKCNEPHTDIDWVTLLHSQQPGLQLLHGKEWIPIPIGHESLVVNCGDMLEHLTGGRFQSGIHRVICPPGVHRFSMPFFGHCKPETSIVPLQHLGRSDLKKFKFGTEIEYLLYRLEQINLRKKAKVALTT
jgi:isopenicillin N synthase-like dioxygenase